MALIEIHADMTGIRAALERIARVLERACPEEIVVPEPVDPPKTGLYYVDPAAEYDREVKEAIARGEDPSAWEYMPPRVGRREGE